MENLQTEVVLQVLQMESLQMEIVSQGLEMEILWTEVVFQVESFQMKSVHLEEASFCVTTYLTIMSWDLILSGL